MTPVEALLHRAAYHAEKCSNGAEEHWRAEREIIKSGRQPALAALSQVQEAEDSLYAPLLSGA